MRIWPVLLTVLGITTTMLLIGFANKGNDRNVCNKVVITIENQLNNHFIDDNDIMSMLTNGYTEAVEGPPCWVLMWCLMTSRILRVTPRCR